jgi:hypothetical protein
VDRGGFEASKPEWRKEVREREKKKDLEVLLYDSPGHHPRSGLISALRPTTCADAPASNLP